MTPSGSRPPSAHKVHFVIVYNLTRFAREKYDHFALRALLKSLGISLRSVSRLGREMIETSYALN